VPWADARSRFTALFDARAIDLLQEMGASAVARELDVSWKGADGIKARTVRRGLLRRRRQSLDRHAVCLAAQLGQDARRRAA